MNNVYKQVSTFYRKYPESEDIFEQNLIERYLRKCAWRGNRDEKLRKIWSDIAAILLYIGRLDLLSFLSLNVYDYQVILCKKYEHSLHEANVQDFFCNIMSFYKYLISLGYVENDDILCEARQSFYIKGVFYVPVLKEADAYYDLLHHLDDITPEEADQLNLLLDTLLNKVGEYFRSTLFLRDITRAIMLYKEPFWEGTPEDKEEFWFSFWDYFFFDYHLIQSDSIPLEYFYLHEKDHLTPSEIFILQDFLKTRFTVFSVDSINEDFAQCTDLFTGVQMELPCPDYQFTDYKKVLLYGHFHANGMILLNYITSVPASNKLRCRIKDEILRQYEMYQLQEPSASLDDFFARHAAAVRHTINILSSFAQLKVVSAKQKIPILRKNVVDEDSQKFVECLEKVAVKLGCSAFSIHLMSVMYKDFMTLSVDVYDSKTGIGAIILLFARMNGLDYIKATSVAREMGISIHSLERMRQHMSLMLHCEELNPRYLSEEGFVRALFMI